MSTLTFDSHEAATAYKTAGFTDAQVEALVAIDRKTTALPDTSTFATRADIGVVEAKLAAVEAKVMRAIEAAKYQILTSVIVAMGALTAIVLSIAKLVR
jgi:tagatose-1,6-bisphosphate aldolase non-catalytic subunit AgaZ/GatZ